jgi:hypothetical protein
MKRNRFQKGSGCYTCQSCKRKTRDTGGGAVNNGLCDYCYEEAGLQNSLDDGNITQADFDKQLECLKTQYHRDEKEAGWNRAVKATAKILQNHTDAEILEALKPKPLATPSVIDSLKSALELLTSPDGVTEEDLTLALADVENAQKKLTAHLETVLRKAEES